LQGSFIRRLFQRRQPFLLDGCQLIHDFFFIHDLLLFRKTGSRDTRMDRSSLITHLSSLSLLNPFSFKEKPIPKGTGEVTAVPPFLAA
jgi:hypothetical protein